jgi:hypothetical protein
VRNPFRLRASQRSVNDEQFVKLFGAGALNLLDEIGDPWNGVVFLRSAPGGGKTTFLRLMTPRPLQLTTKLVDDQRVKQTHDALREVGALSENGPEILGAMVAFTSEYRDLADIDRANGLFRALLNSRIVISTLRAVLERRERAYPDDLGTIQVSWAPESGATIPAKASGQELFDWASEIERGFYDRIDALGEPEDVNIGHARLDGLKWFARSTITDAKGEVTAKRVLLMDELQTLAPSQRNSLVEFVTEARETCGVWVAERLEALNHRDLLSEGALEERDYEGVIQLERRWAGARARSYAKFVEQIANLRAAKADGFENREFFSLIAEQEDDAIWDPHFEAMAGQIESKLRQASAGSELYEDWFRGINTSAFSAPMRAVKWRNAEILMERDKKRSQSSFDFFPLSVEEFEKREKGVERASEHFVRTDLGAPVYFGRETLAAVSSSNVDQYLEVAGELFEEISAKIKGPRDTPTPLSAARQDALLRKVADTRWEGLVRRLPRGYDARRFLDAIGAFCRSQTFRPTAPYAPGVTGIAITMQDRKFLIDSPDEEIKHYLKLRDVLTSLVAHNLLVPRVDHKNKGRNYVVFYLNRLLCVRFNLPLGFGGWREQSLKTLLDWMANGPSVEEEKEGGFV